MLSTPCATLLAGRGHGIATAVIGAQSIIGDAALHGKMERAKDRVYMLEQHMATLAMENAHLKTQMEALRLAMETLRIEVRTLRENMMMHHAPRRAEAPQQAEAK